MGTNNEPVACIWRVMRGKTTKERTTSKTIAVRPSLALPTKGAGEITVLSHEFVGSFRYAFLVVEKVASDDV